MDQIGNVIIYIMMAFVLIGAFSLVFRGDRGVGREFKEGLNTIGPLFVPLGGIMASLPYLAYFTEHGIGKVFQWFGADASIAAGTFIASDMGSYQLAEVTSGETGHWITAMVIGFMTGPTIAFTIPVGLSLLRKTDHKYFALGIMSGILTVPIGVIVTMGIVLMSDTNVRGSSTTDGPSDVSLGDFGFGSVLLNVIPVFIISALLALGLYFITRAMITGFLWFGRILNGSIIIVLAFSIVNHVTGLFVENVSWWGFEPIIATADDQMRALEIAGNVGIVLAGAFPLVYVIRTKLQKPLGVVGRRVGVSPEGTAGLLAASANMLAAFRLIETMRAKDKVLVIAFGVCAGFLIGDHLAFTANFQPNLIVPIMIGKLTGGILAMLIAVWIAVPAANRLEQEEMEKLETEEESTVSDIASAQQNDS